VVLGGGIDQSGQLLAASRHRLRVAIRLRTELGGPPLVLSGGWGLFDPRPKGTTEAEAMRSDAVADGVPADQVVVETLSRDTIGNALYVRQQVVGPRGWRHLVVVTSDFHLARAEYVFRRVLGPDYWVEMHGVTGGEISDSVKVWERGMLALCTKWFGSVADGEAAVEIIERIHPLYGAAPEMDLDDLAREVRVLGLRPANSAGAP